MQYIETSDISASIAKKEHKNYKFIIIQIKECSTPKEFEVWLDWAYINRCVFECDML